MFSSTIFCCSQQKIVDENMFCQCPNTNMLCEGVFEVGEQVCYVFDADGEAEQGVGEATRFADLAGDGAVGHGGGVADEGFDTTKAFGKGEDVEAAHDLINIGHCALELEGNHAAEATHLALG